MFNYNIFWINCSENRVRHDHMRELLERKFPKHQCYHVEAIMHKPKHNGITMSHMIAVMRGMTLGKPFLVLEDDIIINDRYFDEDELEARIILMDRENTHAIYLGVSYWGNMKMKRKKLLQECMKLEEKVVMIDNKIFMKKGARGEDMNDYFFRIRDMFGAHAILYLSKTYMIETLKYCIMAVSQNKPHDIYLPKLQRKYMVLGQKYPWFYQYGKIGGQENGTDVNFSEIRKITSENTKE